jgi:hypothetical protein
VHKWVRRRRRGMRPFGGSYFSRPRVTAPAVPNGGQRE